MGLTITWNKFSCENTNVLGDSLYLLFVMLLAVFDGHLEETLKCDYHAYKYVIMDGNPYSCNVFVTAHI